MSKDIFVEDTMGERSDRIDYWYFTDDVPAVNAPSDDADIVVMFEHGDSLLIRNYLQNVFGLWGYYDVKTMTCTVRRYVLLQNDEGVLASHKVIYL